MSKRLYFAIGGWDKRTIISLVILISISLLIGLFIVTVGDTNSGSASPSQTQDASYSQQNKIQERVETLTAQALYDAREENATRFDDRYLGKRIRIRGQVVKIDNDRVTLGVDATGFGIDDSGLFGVDLNGLPRDVQAGLNRGQRFTAVCEVGNFIIGTIMMEDCDAQ